MSLESQQLDFINKATERLIEKKEEFERRGFKCLAEGVTQAVVAINIMAVTEWGLPSEKLKILA